ncbi:hypothetical protein JTE90_016531 [Oedothorax gibbosus]|uniref:Uncharacterized protein n=1 Tax=Oedothorax gibbosus TaxID=931172 RepID=A0AAV6UWU4_9ARAC|nr:hypothetical protein JTE90_016531 [Oedothorax gibbosus]
MRPIFSSQCALYLPLKQLGGDSLAKTALSPDLTSFAFLQDSSSEFLLFSRSTGNADQLLFLENCYKMCVFFDNGLF